MKLTRKFATFKFKSSNQQMDHRNVNFSIKKSQIHTHMLGLTQKLTKLDIALEGQVFAWDSGSGSQKMAMNELLFTVYRRVIGQRGSNCAKITQKRQKLAETGGNMKTLVTMTFMGSETVGNTTMPPPPVE